MSIGTYILIYFVYGLAFFVLGFSATQQRYLKEHNFLILKPIGYLALFGFTHGSLEWVTVIYLTGFFSNVEMLLSYLMIILSATSFMFLGLFGIKLIDGILVKSNWLKYIPIVITGLILSAGIIHFIINEDHLNNCLYDYMNLSRYFIGFPASLTAALGFFVHRKYISKQEFSQLSKLFLIICIAFLVYAFAAGVIGLNRPYFPAFIFNSENFLAVFRFPIQLVRTLVAITVTVSFVLAHKIYLDETNKRMTFLMDGHKVEMKTKVLTNTLHDKTIQDLFAIGLNLEHFKKHSNEERNDQIEALTSRINEVIESIRDMIEDTNSKQCHPIDNYVSKIKETTKRLSQDATFTIDVINNIEASAKELISLETILNLYYATYEAIMNAVKHSGGDKIMVKIESYGHLLSIDIIDNGVGLKDSDTDKQKYGLHSMQERVNHIGGYLKIKSTKTGLIVQIIIPWEVLVHDCF